MSTRRYVVGACATAAKVMPEKFIPARALPPPPALPPLAEGPANPQLLF